MPYASFFSGCLVHLIPRVEAVYPGEKAKKILWEYKRKIDSAISEIRQAEVMDDMMAMFRVCLWMKDIDSNFIYHNQPCREIILATVLSTNILFLKDTDFLDNALAPLCLNSDKEVIKRCEVLRFIEKAVYPNGESRWLDICKTPTTAPSGRVTGTKGLGVLINRIVSKDLMLNHKSRISIEIPLDAVLTTEGLDRIVKNQ